MNQITEQFNHYAEKILNNSILKIQDKEYRICEIEMYYHGRDHEDNYTHCDELQLKFNQFYPHRFKNGSYKVGTYKCMDITYGDEVNHIYFGILIRSMKNIETNEFFTGPCICVREILNNFNCSEFTHFFDNYIINEFKLIDTKLEHHNIFIGPRVGLSNKYPEFKDKKYRYATHIKYIKKQKKFEPLTSLLSLSSNINNVVEI
jgi:hypothetical protein